MNSSANPTRFHRRPAFTLLELMITIFLTSVLLLGLWTLLSTFLTLREKGQSRAERSQLIRTLHRHIRDDLRNIQRRSAQTKEQSSQLVDERASSDTAEETGGQPDAVEQALDIRRPILSTNPTAEDQFDEWVTEESGLSSRSDVVDLPWRDVDHIQLYGTENAMVMDVFAPAISQPQTHLHSFDHGGHANRLDGGGQDAISQQSEPHLRTSFGSLAERHSEVHRIAYVFVSLEDSQRLGLPAGLMRCDWGKTLIRDLQQWPAFIDLQTILAGLARPINFDPLQRSPVDQHGHGAYSPAGLSSLGQMDQHAMHRLSQGVELLKRHIVHAVQILRFKVRYFDGVTWRRSWDSRADNQLPVAVEVRIALSTKDFTELAMKSVDRRLQGSLLVAENAELDPDEWVMEQFDSRFEEDSTLPDEDTKYAWNPEDRLLVYMGPERIEESQLEEGFSIVGGSNLR